MIDFEYHPDRPYWLYRYFDTDGALLYIGIARNPDQRLLAHRADVWIGYVAEMKVGDSFPTKSAAQDVERQCIKSEKPIFNRRHGDERQHARAVEYARIRGDDPSCYEQRLYWRVVGNQVVSRAQVRDFMLAYEQGEVDAWKERMRPKQVPPPLRERRRPAMWDWPKRKIEVEDVVWEAAREAAYLRCESLSHALTQYLHRYVKMAAKSRREAA